MIIGGFGASDLEHEWLSSAILGELGVGDVASPDFAFAVATARLRTRLGNWLGS
jgi:hypothetical protein